MKEFNIWQVIAGVGIFLIGIQMLESALKNMMGRRFKLFLKKQTGNPLKAILGGTVVTALLQSSSAVNFMVLAFVSTGVITMQNAFAVIMGTNLGTTLDSWIIATVGFKFDIESFAYPVIGIAGLLLFIYGDRRRMRNILSFLIGFSFLFIGLGFMKDAFSDHELANFISGFSDKNNFIFLLIGLGVTTITQSSSATIAITLSFLNVQLIPFEAAIAVVIGSEVGTSLKLLLGSLNGIAAKKRVAVGNIIYNFVTTVIGFSFLRPIAFFITNVLGIGDPLIGLVTFQTGINFLNILLFLPFLHPFTIFISKIFSDKNDHVSEFIYKTKPDVTGAAVDLLKKESEYFIYRSMVFNLDSFQLAELMESKLEKYKPANVKNKFSTKGFQEQYNKIKQHHGEIQSFYIELTRQSHSNEPDNESESYISAVRSCMHSVKCIKDIHGDAIELKNSSNDIKYDFYMSLKDEMKDIYGMMTEIPFEGDSKATADKLKMSLELIFSVYKKNLSVIYGEETVNSVSHSEIATLININRELFTSHKAMVMCFKDLLLPPEQEEYFNEIPTYQP